MSEVAAPDSVAALDREANRGPRRDGAPAGKIDRLLFHTFATDNYVAWAELFLEALRFHHGQRARVRLDGCNLSQAHIDLLRKVHANLDVRNRRVAYEEVAETLGADLETVLGWRDEIEYGDTTDKNFRFKLFVSVDQRYRAMQSVVDEARASGYDYLIHSDVDVYIRRPLESFLDIVDRHDVSVFLRRTKRHRLKVWGGFLGLNLRGNIDGFLERWMAEIDAVPRAERWRGFGQSALWFAIQKSGAEGVDVADLSALAGAPRYSKRFDKGADLWLASNAKVRGPVKIAARRRCWNDLKRRWPRLEPFPSPARSLQRAGRAAVERGASAWRGLAGSAP